MEYITNALVWLDHFNGDNARQLLEAYPDYPVYATGLYLAMVFYLPDYLRRHHKVYKMKWTTVIWNLFLSFTSVAGAYYTQKLLYTTVRNNGGIYTVACKLPSDVVNNNVLAYTRRIHNKEWLTAKEAAAAAVTSNGAAASAQPVTKEFDMWAEYKVGRTAFFVAFFLYLKTPELLDTLFLILQGKPVSFLHWFHHLVTAVYCWHSGYVVIPSGVFFVTVNYTVHGIMYFYYALVCLGYRKKIRWFAPVITLMQVTQMFIGMFITFYTYFQYWLSPAMRGAIFYTVFEGLFSSLSYARHQVMSLVHTGALRPHSEVPAYVMSQHFVGCETDRTNLRMGVMMFACYIVLFCVLFKELYLDKSVNKKSIVLARRQEDSADTTTNDAKKKKKSS